MRFPAKMHRNAFPAKTGPPSADAITWEPWTLLRVCFFFVVFLLYYPSRKTFASALCRCCSFYLAEINTLVPKDLGVWAISTGMPSFQGRPTADLLSNIAIVEWDNKDRVPVLRFYFFHVYKQLKPLDSKSARSRYAYVKQHLYSRILDLICTFFQEAVRLCVTSFF